VRDGIRGERGQQVSHTFGISATTEDPEHSPRSDRTEEIFQVEVHDNGLPGMGRGIADRRPTGSEPVRGVVGRYVIEDLAHKDLLDVFQPRLGLLDEADPAVGLRRPAVAVVTQPLPADRPLQLERIGQPHQLAMTQAEERLEIPD
jgi:hypothetical protein